MAEPTGSEPRRGGLGSSDRRVVLVSGGTRGIGREIVHAFAARGLDVAFTYRSRPDLAERVTREAERYGVACVSAESDAAADDPVRFVETIIDRFGRLDSVVVNAGIWRGGPIHELPEDQWWQVVNTNLGGAYRLARAVVPYVSQSPSGSIVFVSSVVGITGFPGDTAYSSSKAALTGLGRSLAKELARAGTRVNVLAPGFVESDMTAAIPDRARELIHRETLLRRYGEGSEVANAAVFLSEDATFTTGTILTVDGGFTL